MLFAKISANLCFFVCKFLPLLFIIRTAFPRYPFCILFGKNYISDHYGLCNMHDNLCDIPASPTKIQQNMYYFQNLLDFSIHA